MKQRIKQDLLNIDEATQLIPEQVNHPVLNGALRPRTCYHGWKEDDSAVEYANRGSMRKLIDTIRYLLGDERFGKPFSLRQWD